MKKQTNHLQSGSQSLDHNIKQLMGSQFPLPAQVEHAKEEAFASIRAKASAHSAEAHTRTCPPPAGKQAPKGKKKVRNAWLRGLAVAGAAVFCCMYFTTTAVFAQVPIIGHVFDMLGASLEFAGEYANLAEPVKYAQTEMESVTANGTTVTLSEAYCNETALYLSLIVHSKEQLPDTFLGQDGKPMVEHQSMIDFDFDEEGAIDWRDGGSLITDGKMVDDYTYVGVIRFDLGQYYAGHDMEIPENFHAKLSLSKIIGTKQTDTSPEMPQELLAQYEAAMKENGLGLTEEAYEQFTEEQKNTELQLRNDMWNAYYEMYPDCLAYPNSYRCWILEGPWDFEFDVARNDQNIVRQEFDDNENGLGILAVSRTPVEITVEKEENLNHFLVILDADGNLMETSSGSSYTVSVSGHDTSKIDVYVCDYIEYMDELKGYWWSKDYPEKAKEKTFKQLLDERALYHREIVFEEP